MRAKDIFSRLITICNYADALTEPNPKVAAAIVYDNKIISEGFHKKAGGPHAEVIAVNNLKEKSVLSQAKLFVTLEPCNFVGKTPACTNLILKYKIPEVHILIKDPNPKVAGKSIELLRNKGVKVFLYDNLPQAKEYKYITKHFIKNQKKNSAYITLKFAKTSTNIIGSKKQRIKISSFASQIMTHKLRANHQAILVGANTYKIDKPKLNVRVFPSQHEPVKIILDYNNIFSPENFQAYSSGKYYILNSKFNKSYGNINFIVPKIPESSTGWNLKELSKFLYKKLEISSVLVEGGATIIKSFLQQQTPDEIIRITVPKSIEVEKPVFVEDFISGKYSHKSFYASGELTEIFINKKADSF